MQGEIEQAAYAFAKAVDDDEKIVVGVNRYVDPDSQPAEVFPLDPDLAVGQMERTKRVRAERDQSGGRRCALRPLRLPHGGRRTFSIRCAWRSGGWRPSARSPTC